jgi:predicted transcriptional regulator
MARKVIQGPILQYMMDQDRPIRRTEIAEAVSGSKSGVSGALTRLANNNVVKNDRGRWSIIDMKEARWLLDNTYHTKHREPTTAKVIGVIGNGAIKIGDLFEMVGKLNDGTRLVRTLDSGVIYKLEEV